MSCSDNRLDLVPLVSSPSWKLDRDNLWRLPRAHCEEVVRSVCLDEQVRFFRNSSCYMLYLLAVFGCSFFIALANPTTPIRVNRFSLVVRMALCEHGDLPRTVRPQSSLSLGLGLQRLARRRRRRIGSSHTSQYCGCMHLLLTVVCCVSQGVWVVKIDSPALGSYELCRYYSNCCSVHEISWLLSTLKLVGSVLYRLEIYPRTMTSVRV
jgi:hypothetical protein